MNIVSYTDLLYEERDLQEQIETLKKQNSNLDDSLNNLNGFNLEGICSELKVKENAVKIKSNLKAIYKKIDTVVKAIGLDINSISNSRTSKSSYR